MYCGLGLEVPIAPTIVACMAVAMVRALVWTRTKSIVWNIIVCALAVLAVFATLEGSHTSVFQGFWLGVGYGGIGVGIIEIGKSNLLAALQEGLRSVMKTLNTPPLPTDTAPAAPPEQSAALERTTHLEGLAKQLDHLIEAERTPPAE
jgi:hypothetical protein